MIRFPPRRILVGYDRSATAAVAWRHAVSLAWRFGAELEVVYAEPLGGTTGGMSGLYVLPGLSPDRSRMLRREIRAKVGSGPRISVVEGDAALAMVRLAQAHHADMIVLGTHGRAGLARFLMGSLAECVLETSPVPVFVARGPVRDFRAILAPVHFTSHSARGFEFAAGFAEATGARLTALHVDSDPIWIGDPLIRLRRLIRTLPPARRAACEPRVVSDEKPARGIARATAGHDLIVLAARRGSSFGEIFVGMTAEKVLRATKKPLLVFPAQTRLAAFVRAG